MGASASSNQADSSSLRGPSFVLPQGGLNRRRSLAALGDTLLGKLAGGERQSTRRIGRSISLGTEQRFVELENNRTRKRAIEKVFKLHQAEGAPEEGSEGFVLQTSDSKRGSIQSDASSTVDDASADNIVNVQLSLVESMIPDIVADTFSSRQSNEPIHFRRKAFLVLFDIKGFSSYAAELDNDFRSNEDTLDALREQVTSELLEANRSRPRAQQGRATADAEDRERAGSPLMHAAFHRQSDHAGEQLQQTLNRTLHEILVHAGRNGVDVIKFAGDALLCALWQDDASEEVNEVAMVAKLLQFARQAEQTLSKRKDTLKLHIGISGGTLLCVNTGASVEHVDPGTQTTARYSRFEFFVTGRPVVEAGRALDHATESGDICLCSSTHELLMGRGGEWVRKTLFDDLEFEPIASTVAQRAGAGEHYYYRLGNMQFRTGAERSLAKVVSTRRLTSRRKLSIARGGSSLSLHKSKTSGELAVRDTSQALSTLSSYIPGYARYFVAGITSQNQTGHAAMSAFGCKRVVSIIFVQIPWLDSFDADDPKADADHYLEDCNDIMVSLLELVAEYEMCLRQLLVDDKGCVAILVVGAPPLTHDDNASRACFAACSLQMAHQHKLKIGIATGKTYMGPVGNPERHEFAVVGDIVNISARLMGLAPEGKCICDQATRTFASSSALTFKPRPQGVLLKGQPTPVKVYNMNYSPGQSWSQTKVFVERSMHQKALLKYIGEGPQGSVDESAHELNPPGGGGGGSGSGGGGGGGGGGGAGRAAGATNPNRDPRSSGARALSIVPVAAKVAAYVISGEQGVGKTTLIAWAISASREAMSRPNMQNPEHHSPAELAEMERKEKREAPFTAFIDVSPRETNSRYPAWAQLIVLILNHGMDCSGSSSSSFWGPETPKPTLDAEGNNKQRLESSMQHFLAKKAMGDSKRKSKRLSGQIVIRRTAQRLIHRKRFALSRINLHSTPHGIDFGLEASENLVLRGSPMQLPTVHSDMPLSRTSAVTLSDGTKIGNRGSENPQADSDFKTPGRLALTIGGSLPAILADALENAERFSLGLSDFQALKHLGITVTALEALIRHRLADDTSSAPTFKQLSAEEVEDVLVRIIACLFDTLWLRTGAPVIAVFDGAERFEDPSWSLFSKLADLIEAEAMWDVKLIASCSLGDCVAQQRCESTLYKTNIRWLQLSDLSWNGMDSLVSGLFDAKQIDPAISAFLWKQTRGNPKSLMRFVELLVTQRLLKVTEPHGRLCQFSAKTSLTAYEKGFSTLASADLLRRFDRLPRPAQLILQILVVVSIQSVEVALGELFLLFEMCALLYLPQFAKLHFGKPSFQTNFTTYVSQLVIEHFIVVHKELRERGESGKEGALSAGEISPNRFTGDKPASDTEKGQVPSPPVERAKMQRAWTNGLAIARGRDSHVGGLGGPSNLAGHEEEEGGGGDDYFYSADPLLYQGLDNGHARIRVHEYYAPFSERVKETIYGSISEGRRSSLHKDVCTFYETMFLRSTQRDNIEECYSMLAGHCRMSRQPFRCFRYYECVSETCIEKGDYLNAVFALRLCCLACIEFEGFISGKDRVLEDNYNSEVILRFAKWHLQIGKLLVKGGFNISLALASVERALSISEAAVSALTAGLNIPQSVFWAGTSLEARFLWPAHDSGPVTAPHSSIAGAGYSLGGATTGISFASFLRCGPKFGKVWPASSAASKGGKNGRKRFAAMVKIQDELAGMDVEESLLPRFQAERRSAQKLRRRLLKLQQAADRRLRRIQGTLQFELDSVQDRRRKEMEHFFAKSMMERNLEGASYGFAAQASSITSSFATATTPGKLLANGSRGFPIIPTEELLAGIITRSLDSMNSPDADIPLVDNSTTASSVPVEQRQKSAVTLLLG